MAKVTYFEYEFGRIYGLRSNPSVSSSDLALDRAFGDLFEQHLKYDAHESAGDDSLQD